jgi:hypothetical protein
MSKHKQSGNVWEYATLCVRVHCEHTVREDVSDPTAGPRPQRRMHGERWTVNFPLPRHGCSATEGLADVARHVIGCHFTQRVKT